MTVNAASYWRTNAEMIEAVVELGYIKPTDSVIDVTYGKGVWWKKYRHPGPFTACVRGSMEQDGWRCPDTTTPYTTMIHDFRRLGFYDDGTFDVVAFDPDYISPGGRKTSTIPKFNEGYGLDQAPKTPQLQLEVNIAGMRECVRITKPGGIILVKAMSYITSGKQFLGDHFMLEAALKMCVCGHGIEHHGVRWQNGQTGCYHCECTLLGSQVRPLRCEERLVMVGHPGPQPKLNPNGTNRRSVHARTNFSTLFILRKPKPRRPR